MAKLIKPHTNKSTHRRREKKIIKKRTKYNNRSDLSFTWPSVDGAVVVVVDTSCSVKIRQIKFKKHF